MAAPDTDEQSAARRVAHQMLPKSATGFVALLLAFSVGAALSGAVLYSFYDFRRTKAETRANAFVSTFNSRFKEATKAIETERDKAKADIQKEIEPLRRIRAEGDTLESLVKKAGPSLFFIRSLDESGAPSVGTGFAVASDDSQTLVLASYATVRAATKQPGPNIEVRYKDAVVKATLWTWQEDRDLALFVVGRGGIPVLGFAERGSVKTGERVFAASALGAAGGAATQGFVADVSSNGIQHDAAVGQAFQGGPLLNNDGKVVGIASRSFAPLGFGSDSVLWAPAIRQACEKVLRCPNDNPNAPGDRR